jgi:hypothetical protein
MSGPPPFTAFTTAASDEASPPAAPELEPELPELPVPDDPPEDAPPEDAPPEDAPLLALPLDPPEDDSELEPLVSEDDDPFELPHAIAAAAAATDAQRRKYRLV